jgi:K+-transporting ATPase A subunit
MGGQAWFTLILFLTALVVFAYPLSIYMARVGNAATSGYTPVRGPIGKIERIIYRTCGIDIAR